MAIVDWKEIWEGRSGELDQIRAVRRYERVFRIVTDSTYDGPTLLLLNAEFLGLLAPYLDAGGLIDPGAILRNVRVTQPEQDNPFVWLLTYEYSSEPLDVQQRGAGGQGDGSGAGGGDPNAPSGEGIQNPLARPPIFTMDIAKFQRVVDRDVFGTAITNSAGAPFSPLPEVDDSRLVLTMERNEDEPDWLELLLYQDAVNADFFLGFAPGTAKVNIKASAQFENNVYYWKMTYTFEFRNVVAIAGVIYSGWDLHLLDQGYTILDKNGRPQLLLDLQGNPLSEPVLLDGSGHQATLNQGVVGVTVTNGGLGYGGALGPPIVTFSGGGGSGAAATAQINQATGSVSSVFVTNPGSGYSSAPTVAINGTIIKPATAVATLGFVPVFRHFRPYNWLPFAVFGLPNTIT